MKFDPRYKFGIFLPNVNYNYTLIKLTIRSIYVVSPIRTPINEEVYTLLVYEMTSPFFWTVYKIARRKVNGY